MQIELTEQQASILKDFLEYALSEGPGDTDFRDYLIWELKLKDKSQQYKDHVEAVQAVFDSL